MNRNFDPFAPQQIVSKPVQQKQRSFKVDPLDYKPLRVGIRKEQKVIVVEYTLRSTGKRYLHNIKTDKYADPIAFGISVSHSNSFRQALDKEIARMVDSIYSEHCEYLPPERIDRNSIEGLMSQILTFTQTKPENDHAK